MQQTQRTLGIRLKEARLRREMSQEDVGNAIGIHAMTISKYERDQQDPNTMTLAALAGVLDVSTDWLLTEHENFIHHGLKSQEKTMRVVISQPNLYLRVREDTLSDEAIAAIAEFIDFAQARDIKRRRIDKG